MISKFINKKALEFSSGDKITFQKSIDIEIKRMKENGIPLPNLKGFDKPAAIVKSRFGDVNIFGHGKKSNKKIVLFVHGMLSTRGTAIKIFDYYLSRGYWILSYDNFGFGESQEFGINTYGNKEALLLKDIRDYIIKEYEPKKFVIAGESMGGGTIYSFLGKYSNEMADKFVVDSGFMNPAENIKYISKNTISFLAYLAYPGLKRQLKKSMIVSKDYVKPHELKEMNNLLHFHSKEDHLVSYDYMSKYKNLIPNFYTFKEVVKHVQGWYFAKEELYTLLDDFLKE